VNEQKFSDARKILQLRKTVYYKVSMNRNMLLIDSRQQVRLPYYFLDSNFMCAV